MQHLLHLLQHGLVALEIEGGDRARPPGGGSSSSRRSRAAHRRAALGVVRGGRMSAGVISFLARAMIVTSARRLWQRVESDAARSCGTRGAVGEPAPCPARYARRPAGIPRRHAPCPICSAWRATGCPTFSAMSKLPFITPQAPPWPEQRSITCRSGSGMRRSISAAFCPTFCARAWQAMCSATPPESGFRPGARPSRRGDLHHILGDVVGRLGQRS